MNAALPTRPAAGSYGATVAWHGRIAFVTIDGALDFYSAHDARTSLLDLLDAEPSRLLIDISRAFVDSSGIGVLVHVAQRARQERRDFRLLCDEQLGNVLRMHALEELLGVSSASASQKGHDRHRRLAA